MNDLALPHADDPEFLLDSYDFGLPEHLIAQQPAVNRQDARLLVQNHKTGRRFHKRVVDLHDILHGDEVLVVNDTRVIPARLVGRRTTGGRVELLVIPDRLPGGEPPNDTPDICRCLSKTSGRLRPGEELLFGDSDIVRVHAVLDNGIVAVDFGPAGGMRSLTQRVGQIPLPPYIRRDPASRCSAADRERYQTVYAAHPGAVAAPTAGLHLTQGLLDSLKARDIPVVRVTLHVGPGTFLPIRVNHLHNHSVMPEFASISPETAAYLNNARAEGRRVLAVGTTTVRTLEAFTEPGGHVVSGNQEVALTIRPGHRFRAIDAMLTNFHLPKSSLLVLVSAFAGRKTILSAYEDAVALQYRFYSFGDAMLIGEYDNP